VLSTIGAYAIAVWQKLEPLVREARRIENSVLFDDFERLLPACYECYVPALGKGATVTPFAIAQPARPKITPPEEKSRGPEATTRRPEEKDAATEEKITPAELRALLRRGEPLTLLDVRRPEQAQKEPETLPGAVRMPVDEVAARAAELPRDREVVVYCA